jgi:DNA-binding XRE family transcriptional regulator
MPKVRSAKAREIEASFIAGMEQLVATMDEGGIELVRARHSLRTIAPGPFELPTITSKDVVAARDTLGVSQTVFAKILGVSPQSVRAWEQGTKPPSGAVRRLIGEIRAQPDYWRNRFGLGTAA